MPIYERELEKIIRKNMRFNMVISGPRMSGKTTLAKKIFSNHPYINLDDQKVSELALTDPQQVIKTYANVHGLVIDNAHKAPALSAYLEDVLRNGNNEGNFVLIRSCKNIIYSKNFKEYILLPPSLSELETYGLLYNVYDAVYQGGFVYTSETYEPQAFYSAYIRSCIIEHLCKQYGIAMTMHFKKFLVICAVVHTYSHRCVKQYAAEIAEQSYISLAKVYEWLAILEENYVIFFVEKYQPTYQEIRRARVNIRYQYQDELKHMLKYSALEDSTQTRLLFYDIRMVLHLLNCSLPDIWYHVNDTEMFRNFMVADIAKNFYHHGLNPSWYYLNINIKVDVDLLVIIKGRLIPIQLYNREIRDANTSREIIEKIFQEYWIIHRGEDTCRLNTCVWLVSWQFMRMMVSPDDLYRSPKNLHILCGMMLYIDKSQLKVMCQRNNLLDDGNKKTLICRIIPSLLTIHPEAVHALLQKYPSSEAFDKETRRLLANTLYSARQRPKVHFKRWRRSGSYGVTSIHGLFVLKYLLVHYMVERHFTDILSESNRKNLVNRVVCETCSLYFVCKDCSLGFGSAYDGIRSISL